MRATLGQGMSPSFFVVFQGDTTKCDNKKTKTGIGVKGVKPCPYCFFLSVVVAKKIADHALKNML